MGKQDRRSQDDVTAADCGGDEVKAERLEVFEETGVTMTHVFLELDAEGQKVAQAAWEEDRTTFRSLLVNAGKLYDLHEVEASGKREGKPLVKGGAELATKLVAMSREFRRTCVITLERASSALGWAGGMLRRFESDERNRFADFSAVVAILERATEVYEKLLKASRTGEKVNAREVVEALDRQEITGLLEGAVVENKAAHALDLGVRAGQEAETKLAVEAALALPTFSAKVNALGIEVKRLYPIVNMRERRASEGRDGRGSEEDYRPGTRRGHRRDEDGRVYSRSRQGGRW